ncbi:MAG: CHAT domain-containing protein [Bacteroidia bacterium]
MICGLLLIGIRPHAYAQEPQKLFDQAVSLAFEQGKWEASLPKFERAADCFVEVDSIYEGIVCYFYIAHITADQLGQSLRLFDYLPQINAIRDSSLDIDLQLGIALGRAYTDYGQLDVALKLLDQSIYQVQHNFHDFQYSLASAYSNKGEIYRIQGDFITSLQYYEQSAHIFEQEQVWGDWFKVWNNIGLSFKQQERYKEALPYFERAKTKLKTIPDIAPIAKTHLQVNLATTYMELGRYQEAESILMRALSDSQEIGMIYKHLGDNQLRLDNYTRAQHFLDKAMRLRKQEYPFPHPYHAATHNTLGTLYHKKGEDAKSLHHHLQAVAAFLPTNTQLSLYELPPLDQLSIHPELIESLRLLGERYQAYFESSQEQHALESALEVYYYLFDISEQIRQGYLSSEAKWRLAAQMPSICTQAIQTALKLSEQSGKAHYKEAAFAFAERSKAANLYDQLKVLWAKDFANIPHALRQQEDSLIRLRAVTEQQRLEAIALGDTARQNALKDDAFKLQEAQQKLIDRLSHLYPAYFELKYATHVPTLKQIREIALGVDQAMISYFTSETQLYTFTITQDTFLILEQPLSYTVSLDSLLSQLHEGRTIDFIHAQKLYSVLFAPLEPLLTNSSRLVIIPDGKLGYLPFDLLVSHWKEKHAPAFLLERFAFSYHYSARLLAELKSRSKQTFNRPFMGVTPVTYADDQLVDLPSTISMIERYCEMWNGDFLSGNEAEKTLLLNDSNGFTILHFITHAVLDNQNPLYSYLAFNNRDKSQAGRLYLAELYGIQMPTELTVLESCETAGGELRKGEGIISLASAFTYAGSQSILASSWKAQLAGSNQIVYSFYQNLQAGQEKDVALQQAKLRFLSEQGEILGKAGLHPHIWAGQMLIGDSRPLPQTSSWWQYVLTMLVLITGIYGLGKLYRKKIS